jgi:hypothetical protein
MQADLPSSIATVRESYAASTPATRTRQEPSYMMMRYIIILLHLQELLELLLQLVQKLRPHSHAQLTRVLAHQGQGSLDAASTAVVVTHLTVGYVYTLKQLCWMSAFTSDKSSSLLTNYLRSSKRVRLRRSICAT